jgi:4-alpha-glucanotransferase
MYVRYPHTDLLDIVARESQDACAFVVGEDLGTVEPEVRVEMAARRMLSSRIMWFEDDEPSKYPELSVAAVTNHDLPTIAGVWTGADLAEQRALGLNPDASAAHSLRRRLRELGVSEDAPVEEVVRATYERLATAGSAVVLGTLEDALGIRRRPNLPGTSSYQRDNWSIGLPKPLEEVTADPLVADVARALASHRS